MQGQPNPKIVGSFIIGFALVAGAYVVANFGKTQEFQVAAVTNSNEPAPRVAITVTDNDNNGIEDWRDDFVTTEPVILNSSTTVYTPPDTLTGQLGINFMESIIRARGYGPFGRTDEEVISDTVRILEKETAHELYDTPDIIISQDTSDAAIRSYANAMAEAISRNSIPNLESELVILQDILSRNSIDRMAELESLTEVYSRTRDDSLNVPVPAFLVKEHLDLINTYHAIHKDIEAMTKSIDDPAYTLLRLKRYEDDAAGLGYALRNMYNALEPHAGLFTVNDPAALFVIFSPNFQI